MKSKTIYKYLGIRIGVLVLSLISMFAIWYFKNDLHDNCVGEYHNHTFIELALFVGFLIVLVGWFVVLFIEWIMYCIKKESNILAYLLMIILVLAILALAFI